MTDQTDTNTDVGGSYIVFRLVSEDLIPDPNEDLRPMWEQINDVAVSAVNQRQAIEHVTDEEGTFLAVPARSFKPMTRQLVTKVEWS